MSTRLVSASLSEMVEKLVDPIFTSECISIVVSDGFPLIVNLSLSSLSNTIDVRLRLSVILIEPALRKLGILI